MDDLFCQMKINKYESVFGYKIQSGKLYPIQCSFDDF